MESLRSSREFRRVIEGGDRVELGTITIFILPNREGKTRLGISVSRKTGGSVERNRIKRRIKEAARNNAHRLPQGSDIVIIARRNAREASYHDIVNDIIRTAADMEEAR